MRICCLMEPPRSADSVTHGVLQGLRAGGAQVEIVTARDGVIDLRELAFDHDLYLFKSHEPLAESLAAAAHYRGARLLNAYPATMKVRDKALTAALLLEAGVPTPRTFLAGSLEELRPAVREVPLVVKPNRGHRGEGVEICRDEAQLDALLERRAARSGAADGDERMIFAQEYLEAEPLDIKAYAIGEDVCAIRRVFPARTREEKLGRPVGPDAELEDLVRRCGRVFGLQLYGVDLVKTPRGYCVVEVNCFPGYKGVPGGGERIARFVLHHAG